MTNVNEEMFFSLKKGLCGMWLALLCFCHVFLSQLGVQYTTMLHVCDGERVVFTF